jgi:hypothetical protein
MLLINIDDGHVLITLSNKLTFCPNYCPNSGLELEAGFLDLGA